jgi:cysteine synthase
MAGNSIVMLLPDSGKRYLSSILFDGMFNEQGLTT